MRRSGHRDETANRLNSDFGSLRQEQRILYLDAKIPNSVLDLGVTEQYLDRTDITCRPLDHRCLRAAKRASSIFLGAQTDRGHPLVNEACILPGTHVLCVIDPAWEYKLLGRAPRRSSQARSLALTSPVILNWTGRPVFC
ncbi:hypothetical protein CHELA17_64757 [Chelatococcus asaccharovorans]|nr:hypothetical protein CHELA17_64757 [Chelatococcus asaccharovorans]